jgi:hypothetical protein
VSRDRAVTVRIDELVVRGFPLADPAGFGDDVTASLERLLTDRGLPDTPGPAGAAAPVSVAVDGARPSHLAERVAEAVWRALAPEDRAGGGVPGGEAER